MKYTCALLFALIASPEAEAEVTNWRKVSGWDIDFYSSLRACQAYTTYEGGTGFFIGFTNIGDDLLLDVTLMDKSWRSIEAGKEYGVKVFFGDETPWTLNMEGENFGETPGLTFSLSLNEKANLFAEEFQRETRMAWYYEGVRLGNYTLRGSRKAFQETLACQKSYISATSSTGDPFARSSGDPFAR